MTIVDFQIPIPWAKTIFVENEPMEDICFFAYKVFSFTFPNKEMYPGMQRVRYRVIVVLKYGRQMTLCKPDHLKDTLLQSILNNYFGVSTDPKPVSAGKSDKCAHCAKHAISNQFKFKLAKPSTPIPKRSLKKQKTKGDDDEDEEEAEEEDEEEAEEEEAQEEEEEEDPVLKKASKRLISIRIIIENLNNTISSKFN
ncbi:hypothetical protein DFA_00919 [Cavenderia fasciculata]|uniref:Uncharacterized protein n=1 Tax=Cavenderia fasciculata TaxID=261658 RepID=F4PUH4_CACFS|nr:uncharacterized protein DFA_00919 [Cavenderia fasciculata]EGG21046.1 hypothetical protein DFA_00919 [Cavenderia fasciculata]|eukprot:XP_004358896.1 hypothetical protein DFA_00919 [Cavenderia fasciculata]